MSRLVLSLLVCSLALMPFPLMAADLAAAKAKAPNTVSFPAPTDLELKIRNALHERTEVHFADTPLTDGLKFLADVHGITVFVDRAALQDEGVDPSSPLSLETSGITLRSTLRLMLKPMQLTYIIEDEVLKITTEAKADEAVVTRVYPVRDLADDAEELESIVEAVQAGCAKPSWEESHVSITSVKKSRSLVIRQSQKVHEEIEALLRDLRAANAGAEAVEPGTDRRIN